MKHNATIENKNSLGFFVNNLLFSSISEAEAYCDEMGIHSNEIVHNPERAKKYAITILPLLYELKRQLDNRYETLYQKAKQMNKEVEVLTASSEKLLMVMVNREIANDHLLEIIGTMQGHSVCCSKLLERILNYERIARNQESPVNCTLDPYTQKVLEVENMTNEAQRLNDFTKYMTGIVNPIFTDWLTDNGFFKAPASTKYHGAYEGGLYDHSKAVAVVLADLTGRLTLKWERPESPLIIGMFHDLCKIDAYTKVVDMEGTQYFGGAEAQGGETHFECAEPILKGHGDKSIMLLSQFMTLTHEEMLCIRFHMGAYNRDDWDGFGRAISENVNVLYTHTADMVASKVKGV